jgi:hypothetical protein
MNILVSYLQDDRKTITESVLYDSTELDHILTDADLVMLKNGDTIEMIYEGVPCTLSFFNGPRYYWRGHFGTYEVMGFGYDEDRKILYLYTYDKDTRQQEIITETSFVDSEVKLETFTDEEINEYLLDFFEEYVSEEDK